MRIDSILKQRAPYYLLIAILLLGAHIRFVAIDEIDVVSPVRADAMDYLMYAYNMEQYGVYSRSGDLSGRSEAPPPDAVRSPGYPIFLIPFLDSPPTTNDLEQIKFAQALLGTATIALTFVIAVSVMSSFWALLPALLVAISPHLVTHTVYLITETWFTFLFTASVAILVGSKRYSRRLAIPLLAGIMFGLSALTRPTVMYLGFAFVVLSAMPIRFYSRKYSLLLLVGLVLTVTPWLARNQSSLGELTDSQLVINTLHHGMYPGFMFEDNPDTHGFPYRFDPRSDIVGQSVGSVLHEIVNRFKSEPIRHVTWYLVEKPLTLWSWNIINGMGGIYTYPVRDSPYNRPGLPGTTLTLMKAMHWPLVLLSLLGAVVVWFPQASRVMNERVLLSARGLSLIVLYFLAVHIVGAPFPRYSIPLRPITYTVAIAVIFYSVMMVRAKVNARSEARSDRREADATDMREFK